MQAVLLALRHRTLWSTRWREDAIRRLRDTHRSSMLAATEQAFSDLTQGAYSTLNRRSWPAGRCLDGGPAADGV